MPPDMAEESSLSLPVRLLLRTVLTILLVWAMSQFIPEYFLVKGGPAAFVIIGCLITLMNIIVRPILHILTFPLHIIFSLLAMILTNWAFIWLTARIASTMDTTLVTLTMSGGTLGLIVCAIVLGFANLVFKHLL